MLELLGKPDTSVVFPEGTQKLDLVTVTLWVLMTQHPFSSPGKSPLNCFGGRDGTLGPTVGTLYPPAVLWGSEMGRVSNWAL